MSVLLFNLIIYFTILISFGRSANILGIFPIQCPSHRILGSSLMKGLAERGHSVAIITTSPENVSIPSYEQIVLTGIINNDLNFFDTFDSSAVTQTLTTKNWALQVTQQVLEHANVKKLLASNRSFDAVIVDQFFTDALKGFAWHYKAPLIIFSAIGANSWFNSVIGNPSPPSYIPEMLSSFTFQMNFWERIQNSLLRFFVDCVLNFSVYPAQNKILHDHFPHAPHINEILNNVSLALVNSDISFHQAVPKVPTMIDIAGFHVKPTGKLPEDLKKILDEATEGAIYFSMGSNLKSAQMPNHNKELFLRAFSKLKEKVLWKFEEDLPGRTNNVEIRKWFPQQELLSHPNLKLFITHGGLLSITETLFHGLPVLAIPVFGDQKLNAARAAQKGFGLFIHYKNLTEDYFEHCLSELLTNKRYTEKAKQISRIFHDRPIKPMDSAIYWVEYVMRHQGATHLRVEASHLNIFQYFLVDVLAVFFIFVLFLVFVLKYLFLRLLNRKSYSLSKKKTQ